MSTILFCMLVQYLVLKYFQNTLILNSECISPAASKNSNVVCYENNTSSRVEPRARDQSFFLQHHVMSTVVKYVLRSPTQEEGPRMGLGVTDTRSALTQEHRTWWLLLRLVCKLYLLS